MSAPTIQTFDQRRPIIVNASEIRPNDWLSDLGTLRQVEYVDTLGVRTGSGLVHIVHFKSQRGVQNLARGVSDGTSLTVWRTTPQEGSPGDAEA
jgi:hypothetical protein